jgi:hypothetical protein
VTSPAQLRRLLAAAEARAERLRGELATAIKEAALFRELLALHSDVNSRTLPSEQMQADSRDLAISKGSKSGKDPFLVAIRAKGYTLRSLATKVGCPASLLSMQRKGDRPIPGERAAKIEKLTGWPATAKGWPGGLS